MTATLTDLGMAAAQRIEDVTATGTVLADLAAREALLIAQRPVKKLEAIDRMMGGTNIRTAKPHTYSSAEQSVETDPEYMAFLAEQARALREKLLAQAHYQAAKLRAQLALAMLAMLLNDQEDA